MPNYWLVPILSLKTGIKKVTVQPELLKLNSYRPSIYILLGEPR
jgi:hypothetical protein